MSEPVEPAREQQWIQHHHDLGHKTLRLEPNVLRCTCGSVYKDAEERDA